MVGFDTSIKTLNKPSKNTEDQLEISNPDSPDFSLPLVHSIPNFDFIDEWIMESLETDAMETTAPGRTNSEMAEVLPSENSLEMPVEESCKEEQTVNGSDTKELSLEMKVEESCKEEQTVDGSDTKNVEVKVTEAMEKVSLVGGATESSDLVEQDKVLLETKSENMNLDGAGESSEKVKDSKESDNSDSEESEEEEDDDDDDDDDSSTTSSSSSSSSSESSSDEEEEEEEDEETGEAIEVEEGEIRELVNRAEMVGGSDDEDDGGVTVKGPIKSRNEVQVLPLVPKVDVTLEPHHQTLPVGVVLSIMDAKVIVEGIEKHNPLNEGSILWITETRSVLGLVDEIFGPVKNPYYVVRYNSEDEVPSGIQQGTPISFVAEFADHVLNDKNIYKKGYDASGENDEEVTDEAEFSDDEKEAEYKRMQRVAKRGPSDDKNIKKQGNREFVDRKKFQPKSRASNNNQPSVAPSNAPLNQFHLPPIAAQAGSGSFPRSFGTGTSEYGPSFVPSTSQVPQVNDPTPAHNQHQMFWGNGMPYQQAFSNGFSMNGMPMPYQQPPLYYQHQMFSGFTNGMPMHPSQRPMLESTLPYGPSNFSPGVPAPMPMFMGQPGFNQRPFVMGFQGYQAHPHMNSGEHGVRPHGPSNESHINEGERGVQFHGPFNPTQVNEGGDGVQTHGSFNEQNHGMLPQPSSQGNFPAQNQFNRGSTSARGGRSYRRGGGRGGGGRGRR